MVAGWDQARALEVEDAVKRLPVTGASVVGVLIVGSLMLLAGILLLRRRKRDESST